MLREHRRRFASTEQARRLRPLVDHGRLSSMEPVVAVGAGAVGFTDGGLGPIDRLLGDPAIDEIMINGPGMVWVEHGGRLRPAGVELDRYAIELVVERIVGPLGLRVDRTAPIADARLADGSRVSIVVPPLAENGPLVTIRKFADRGVSLGDFGPRSMIEVIDRLILDRATMVVVGPTSSGKTSLLNAILARCPHTERVVCIEDTAELALSGPNRVRLEARPANSEGIGEVTIRRLVTAALRMRPDRLVVGEVRGAEAFDLLLALSSGHDGSLATCHAADVESALDRLETLVALAGVSVGSTTARRLIHQAVDVVVVVGRGAGRSRRVVEIGSPPSGPGGRSELLWRADP